MGCPVRPGNDATDESEDDVATDEASAAGLDRRSFMKSALLIGGASALDQSVDLFGVARGATSALDPADPVTVAERSNRQHAWDAYEHFDETKETSIPPSRHLFLHLDYLGDGRPSERDRRRVAGAFDRLEELFEWSSDGLLFTVGYSPSYFDRYEETLPLGLDPESGFAKPGLLRPETLIETEGVTLPHEDPVADTYDAVVHLASNHEQLLLAVEQLLWEGSASFGDRSLSLPDMYTLDGIFSRAASYPERRVGFVGHENLEAEGGEEDEDGVYPAAIPEDAELSMGFNDLFRNSVPRETNATMVEEQQLVEPKPPGAFAQGSIQHVSKLDIDLDPEDGWYQYDTQQRRERMFSPDHDAENTGDVGDQLGNSNAPGDTPVRDVSSDADDLAERTETDAESEGVVGHVQKVARARFDLNRRLTDDVPEDDPLAEEPTENETGEDYDTLPGHDGPQEAEQVVLRRDVDTTDTGRAGNHFMALMRFNPYMVYMRQAMNGVAFDSATFGLDGDARIQHDDIRSYRDDVDDGYLADPDANGIANFLETKRRGNYVVPPLRLRALPPAQAAGPPMAVAPDAEGLASLPDEGTVRVVVGAGESAVADDQLSVATAAWREGRVDLDSLRGLVDDYRESGQLLSDGYEPDPRDDQPEEYDGPTSINPETIAFGPRREVNAGGGAAPTDHERRDVDGDGSDELVLTFDAADLSFTEETRVARLYAETRNGYPVFATEPVNQSAPGRALRRTLAVSSE